MSNPQKIPKLSHSDNQNYNEDAIAGPSNMESPPKIFNLTIDSLDEIFEYLNVRDLHSFGQTCKRMRKVAGEYYKQNYISAEKYGRRDGIYTKYWDKDGVVGEETEISVFGPFMKCITFDIAENERFPLKLYSDENFEGPLRYAASHIKEFKSIDHISLTRFSKINHHRIKFIEKLLPQLESIKIDRSKITCNFYEVVLKQCHNLKKMLFHESSMIEKKWLSQHYPKLKHFGILDEDQHRFDELSEFFVRNPTLRTFLTNFSILWKNREIFLNATVKLNTLVVYKGNIASLDGSLYLNQIVDLLNQLHEHGFYKELHIHVDRLYQGFSALMTTLPALKLLYIEELKQCYDLPQLTNLEVLIINFSRKPNVKDCEMLANNLIKLERLEIGQCESIYTIMPFIRRSRKLNKIIMKGYNVHNCSSRGIGGALNLTMLDKERAKLDRARKITIYVRDDVFLATKWAFKNGETNLSHIEMRRMDSR
ncbi:uncharacterized protein LOC116339121 [Contarinia nasturtii]|uniref:uncharacterized protein LOC116339121 n=1 Tax=Contarinia nasturtii TaxID=265458 RepID=UPI0012D483B5|nr:uncharacterized protein LOC116339121 [Contarinia nasturtii]